MEHDKTWWYVVAERLFPSRVREIPEANDPSRIVLRQVALIKRYVYLQQFSSHEDYNFFHSHQWHFTIAIGLKGGYIEERRDADGNSTTRKLRLAPYLYAMDKNVEHRVALVGPGHTSIFIGLFRNDSLKKYRNRATGERIPWESHVKKLVARI